MVCRVVEAMPGAPAGLLAAALAACVLLGVVIGCVGTAVHRRKDDR